MNRLENKQCLKCGEPNLRFDIDGVPLCSVCEKLLRKMAHQLAARRPEHRMVKRLRPE